MSDDAEAALFRITHGPENVRALKNIARRYFKGRTPTIVATLDHRTKKLEAAMAALKDLLAEHDSLLHSDYPMPEESPVMAAARALVSS